MVLTLVPGAGGGALVAQTTVPRPFWRVGLGLSAGVLLAPGEIGRATNATGAHEALIGRLGDALALGGHLGIDSRHVGAELRLVLGTRRIEVKNEAGTGFPNHGEHPLLWSGNLLVYPLGLLQGSGSRLPRPLLAAGLGGAVLSADLDNVKGQTLFHSFLWSLGGGVRLGIGRDGVLEARLARHRVWRNGALRSFEATAVTLGLGVRY